MDGRGRGSHDKHGTRAHAYLRSQSTLMCLSAVRTMFVGPLRYGEREALYYILSSLPPYKISMQPRAIEERRRPFRGRTDLGFNASL